MNVWSWGGDSLSGLTGMMVTTWVADLGSGSGAGAPAGCGAEPREKILGLQPPKKHPEYIKVERSLTPTLQPCCWHNAMLPCLACWCWPMLLALRVRCCWARAQGAHRSAFCTHEELATAVRRMPMYTACGCRFVARGCRKQCAVMSARSALLEKWNGLSERRKCLILALLLLVRTSRLKQSCSSSRDLSNGPFTSIHFDRPPPPTT